MKSKKAFFLGHAWSGMAATPGQKYPIHYWLLLAPAFIVFFYQVGRGLGNTGYALYWIAAVTLLVSKRNFEFPVGALILYLALLAWGALSAALSVNPGGAYGKWAQYALLGSGYFITWSLVRSLSGFSLERALKTIGIVGLVCFVYYAAQFLFLSGSSDFRPEMQVHGLVPAYLAPFALYFLWQSAKRKRGVVLSLAYLTSLTLLLVFSNSLTEVLTLAAALAVLTFFIVPNKRLLLVSLGGAAFLFVALILLFDPAGRMLNEALHSNEGWFTFLNQLSSYRAQLWYQALTIPPPNQWLGVGPSNVGLYPPVIIDEGYRVGHLHNLFLDCWYELGVIGFMMYLLFYGMQIHLMRSGALYASRKQRGVMYATVAGIFVAAMLEQSYRSIHAALFVPFLFALYSGGGAKMGQKIRV